MGSKQTITKPKSWGPKLLQSTSWNPLFCSAFHAYEMHCWAMAWKPFNYNRDFFIH